MAKLGLVFLLLAQMLVLQSMAEQKPLQLKAQIHERNGHEVADQPVSGSGVSSEYEVAEAPGYRRLGKHHSTDKSVAGGGVIIGGLVTAIFAAVFCYIRVTRKRDPNY